MPEEEAAQIQAFRCEGEGPTSSQRSSLGAVAEKQKSR